MSADEQGPFETLETLMAFLVENDYAGYDRKGMFRLFDGGRDYLLCRIAVSVNTWAMYDEKQPV